MKRSLINEIYRNEKRWEKIDNQKEKHDFTISSEKSKRREEKKLSSTVSESLFKKSNINAISNSFKISKNNQIFYYYFQAIFLTLTTLLLSYHAVFYGKSEYSILENGQIINGNLRSAAADDSNVVTLIFGYSIWYSIVWSIAVFMLMYSLFSKKPRLSLPSIILSITDLISDIGDAVVAIWLFFSSLPFGISIFYSLGIILIILTEFWISFGLLKLYEDRTFYCF